VLLAAEGPGDGRRVFVSELCWREFYAHVLWHFPHVVQGAYRPAYDDVPWADDPAGLAAWRDGRTGYPVVDAAMRQLAASGWMHNRARMIAASFLAKDLLVDWRHGAAHFMAHLVDGDTAANNGGWQWTAGTGTDAAPYFRVFNPVAQGRRFDPDGTYVRRWIPELARVPDAWIHEPWAMPDGMQAAAGCIVGRDYPAPIVDHAFARDRALAAYAAAKRS
jgi:deoxyribodipyrimidine photo-lyase